MLKRQGFTLIELLIVVTIIAILAGAAVPYVQDYVEQTRTSRARADLDEIKRAVMLYEVQFGRYTSSSIASLVGPFLTRNIPDPWGNAYVVSDASSTVLSLGPDGSNQTGDEISAEYRPRMAVTRAYFVDVDGDGMPSDNDGLTIKVCRPASTTFAPSNTGLAVKNYDGTVVGTLSGTGEWLNDTTASFTLSGADTMKVSSSTLQISASNDLCDLSNTTASGARADVIKILTQ